MTTKTIKKDKKDNEIDVETKILVLSNEDKQDIEDTFNEARDFRHLGEKITSPLDGIISRTAKVIDADPIMNVSDELSTMNNNVQDVYKDIIDNDGTVMKIAKSLPIIGALASKLDSKWDEASFNMKSLEGKIEVIFSGFDQAYSSINTSIDMQRDFIDGIDENLGKVIGYKEFLVIKVEEFKSKASESKDEKEKMKYDMFLRNVEYFLSNLVVLIGNLEMARKRLLMRLDSASKLSLAMNSSRPIFKTLLSTALIETSSQKALDASMKAIDIMGKTIDKMSSELTDKAIESSKRSEQLSSTPVLSASIFVENVTKLKNHFDEIESYREEVKKQADAERELFTKAKKELDAVKTLSSESQEEFINELI